MGGRAFRREAQHSHARLFKTCNGFGCAGGADGNLCQLLGVGFGGYGHVAHHDDAFLAKFGSVGQHNHGAGDAGDARFRLDDLQRGAQHIGRGVAGTGQLAVGLARLNHQAAVVERVVHQAAGFLQCKAFLLAQFGQQFGKRLVVVGRDRVNDFRIFDVSQVQPLGQTHNFLAVAQQYHVGHAVGQHAVGGFDGTFLCALGQYDALLLLLRTLYQFTNNIHRMFFFFRGNRFVLTCKGTNKRLYSAQ